MLEPPPPAAVHSEDEEAAAPEGRKRRPPHRGRGGHGCRRISRRQEEADGALSGRNHAPCPSSPVNLFWLGASEGGRRGARRGLMGRL